MSFQLFQLPPNNFSPAELRDSNKKPVYVTVAVGFALATIAVSLRLTARRISKVALGWDDYTIILALLLLYGLNVTDIVSVAKYGLGRHFPVVYTMIVPFQKASLANIVLWLATAAATKASLLFLYYRLFSPSKRFRVAVRIGAVVVFCQWFSMTLVGIFQCSPVEAFWNRAIKGARCIDTPVFSITSGVLNLLTDVLILCLPVRMVWGLNTTVTQKITLTGIFLLGIFVCVVSIIRISKLASVIYSDPTWRLVDVYVWTTIENFAGIISACLPTLKPLFGRFSPGTSKSGSSNQKVGRPGSRYLVKAQFGRLSEDAAPALELQDTSNRNETGSARTNLDSATSNEHSSVDRASLGPLPLHSVNSTSQLEDEQYLRTSTRRAGYELRPQSEVIKARAC